MIEYIYIKDILIEKIGNNKLWAVVKFTNDTMWAPGLIEQAKIAQCVVNCEKAKYKYAKDPAKMPKEFLTRAIEGENVCALASLFNLTHTNSYKKLCLMKGK